MSTAAAKTGSGPMTLVAIEQHFAEDFLESEEITSNIQV
jgi:hypothetical protein